MLAIILCLPLSLTVLTGMATTIVGEWSWNLGLPRGLLLGLHTGEIFHLQAIYPILNGLGLIGLLVTGATMTSVFKGQKTRPSIPDASE
jgi:hypothetical protein